MARRPKPRRRRAGPTHDARRYPRAEAVWDVAVEVPGRRPQKRKMVGLGPFGARLRLNPARSRLRAGSMILVRLSPPDGEPPMAVQALVWRSDRRGEAVVFVNLRTADFLRLKKLVNALRGEPA